MGAYGYTMDQEYVYDLFHKHTVQILVHSHWVHFSGQILCENPQKSPQLLPN